MASRRLMPAALTTMSGAPNGSAARSAHSNSCSRFGEIADDVRARPPAFRWRRRSPQMRLARANEHDARARFGVGLRDRLSDAGARACDERDLADEREELAYGNGSRSFDALHHEIVVRVCRAAHASTGLPRSKRSCGKYLRETVVRRARVRFHPFEPRESAP
jgi:hypothetical protein